MNRNLYCTFDKLLAVVAVVVVVPRHPKPGEAREKACSAVKITTLVGEVSLKNLQDCEGQEGLQPLYSGSAV